MAYLVVTGPGKEPFRSKLESDKPAVVGRQLGVEVWIDDPRLSRRHCRLMRSGGQEWLIEDLGSPNGTWIDKQRIYSNKPQPLRDGETIEIGNTRLIFHAGSYVGDRPSNPKEAMALQRMLSDSMVSRTSQDTIVHGSKPHAAAQPGTPCGPVPRPRKREELDAIEGGKPLPFVRPPAQPILDEEETSDDAPQGWLGALIGKRKRRGPDET
jgi:predicted component of type VI protein secretion system